MRFIKGVAASELLALWVEFFYKIGVKGNPGGLFAAILIYFFSPCVLHAMFAKLQGMRLHRTMCVVLGGGDGGHLTCLCHEQAEPARPVAYFSSFACLPRALLLYLCTPACTTSPQPWTAASDRMICDA